MNLVQPASGRLWKSLFSNPLERRIDVKCVVSLAPLLHNLSILFFEAGVREDLPCPGQVRFQCRVRVPSRTYSGLMARMASLNSFEFVCWKHDLEMGMV